MVHDRVPENQILAHKSITISFVGNIYLQVVTYGVANWNKETPSTSTSAWVVPWCLQQKIEKQPGLTDVEEVPKYIHLAPSPSYIHFTTILWIHTNSTYLAVSWKTLCSSHSHPFATFPTIIPHLHRHGISTNIHQALYKASDFYTLVTDGKNPERTTSWYGKYPMIYRVSYMSACWGCKQKTCK